MKAFGRILMAFALLSGACFFYSSCKQAEQRSTRSFPEVKVPAVVTDPAAAADYLMAHYWDAYLTPEGRYLSDSLHIAGVAKEDLIRHIAEYAVILGLGSSPDKAPASLKSLVGALEKYQAYDSLSNAYPRVTELLRDCLFDPNSELRDESLYQPLAESLAHSSLVADNMRPSYAYEARMCALNAKGSKATDFRYIDTSGKTRHLYDSRTRYTLLVFVNPGCHACGEATAAFSDDRTRQAVEIGALTVISIYIDEDIDEWKARKAEMPDFWINGYDPEGIIRKDLIYNVRAIPSLYLLDSSHTVLLKDAPVSVVQQTLFYPEKR